MRFAGLEVRIGFCPIVHNSHNENTVNRLRRVWSWLLFQVGNDLSTALLTGET